MKYSPLTIIALTILTIFGSIDASAQRRGPRKTSAVATSGTAPTKKGIKHLPAYEVDPVAVDYLHPDLAFFHCRGQVKSFRLETFDENGKYILDNAGAHHDVGSFSKTGKTLIDITEYDDTRDKDGHVIGGQGMYDGCRQAIRWQNGQPIYLTTDAGSVGYDQYLYDDKGYVSKVMSYGGPRGNMLDTYEYEYLEFDDHDNWTKRKVTHTSHYAKPVKTETWTQTCKYTYY